MTTLDIKAAWDETIRQLRDMVFFNPCSTFSVCIAVDTEGLPVRMTKPKISQSAAQCEQNGNPNNWFNVARRFQSVSKTQGCAIVKMTITLGTDKNPLCYTSPTVTKLEPWRSCHIDKLVNMFHGCEDEMIEVLVQ